MSRMAPWLLIVSLLVNGFLAGMLVTGREPPPGAPPPRPDDIIDRFAEAVPPEDARVLREAAMAVERDVPPDMDAFRDRMAQILVTDPFDQAAFAALTASMRRDRERMGERLDAVLAAALPRMSTEGRRRLAELRPPGLPRNRQ